MRFYKYLYVGESIKDPAKVKWKLKTHCGQMIHILCYNFGCDQLEIMHSGYLKQGYYRKHPPVIVGIASDYNEAVELVLQITRESLEQTGSCDLKAYLKKKAKGTAW